MSTNYPIMLRLEGKLVVVVGGGRVAERKVSGLLGTGARISVVSPVATVEIQRLAQAREIVWKRKSFSVDDIDDAFMIFAATDDKEINHGVKTLAGNHQLVAVVDDPDSSDFHLPSHLRRGRLSIAVSTGGASPTLANNIRLQLEQQFDVKYKDFLEFLFETRKWILTEVDDASLKRKLLTAIVSDEYLNSQNRAMDFQRLYEELM